MLGGGFELKFPTDALLQPALSSAIPQRVKIRIALGLRRIESPLELRISLITEFLRSGSGIQRTLTEDTPADEMAQKYLFPPKG